ncbi:MAG: hypothetical protein WED11_02400, partial [Natronospirillum sp.]
KAEDDPTLLGPLPIEVRRLTATRWDWLFPDTDRKNLSGTVLWVEALTERYQERSSLPAPTPVAPPSPRLMPLPVATEPKITAPVLDALPAERPGALLSSNPPELDQAPLVELARLIRQRQDGAAVSLARQLQPDYEGEPDYDLLLGRALMNVSDYQEATFAVERALIVVPRDINARLTLAEAYLGLGNTGAVRRQLQRLEDRTLDEIQEQRRQSVLEGLRARELARQRRDAFSVSGELQYYTNINSGLGVDVISDIEWLGTDFVVDDASKSEAAPAVLLQASAERSVPLNQRLRRTTLLGLTTRVSTFSDANNLGGVASLNWAHDGGRSGGVQIIPSWTQQAALVTTILSGQQQDVLKTMDMGVSAAWTVADSHSLLTTVSLSDTLQFEPLSMPLPWQAAVSGN